MSYSSRYALSSSYLLNYFRGMDYSGRLLNTYKVGLIDNLSPNHGIRSLAESASQIFLAPSELNALEDLFNACNGRNWTWYGNGNPWDFSPGNSINPCFDNWEGVMCSCNMSSPMKTSFVNSYYAYYDDEIGSEDDTVLFCSISKLYLNGHNLQGTLPNSLGNLVNLTHLHLSQNSISGTIPDSIYTNCTQIQLLIIENNLLRGTIPNSIGNLQSLRYYLLESNSLTSTIPSTIAKCKELVYFGVCVNSMTGTIPSSIFFLPELTAFAASFNMLNGTIPATLINFHKAQQLILGNNSLTGPFPVAVYSLKNLFALGLHNNNFYPSSIPRDISNLANLEILYLTGCSLTNSIPVAITTLTKLNYLFLDMNSLTGTIPCQISALQNLIILELNDNNLYGTIPTQLGLLSQLIELYLRSNYFTGTIPSQLGDLYQLTQLYLNANSLSGAIPISFGRLTNLQYLLLGENQLSSSISESIFTSYQHALYNLTILEIANNRFTGSVPSQIFQLPHLSVFAASLNCLSTQSITNSICQGSNLTVLSMNGIHASRSCRGKPYITYTNAYYNYYPETYTPPTEQAAYFPICLISLPNIVSLQLAGNGLLGNISISDDVTIPSTLTHLEIGSNYLQGTIPYQIQNRQNWKKLDLSFNEFTGTLASTMQLPLNTTFYLNVNRLSGSIPQGLLQLTNISILQGNYFDCPLTLGPPLGLPVNDDYASRFDCGSNSFDLSITFYASAVAALSICIAILNWNFRKQFHEFSKSTVVGASGFPSDEATKDNESPASQLAKVPYYQIFSKKYIENPLRFVVKRQIHSATPSLILADFAKQNKSFDGCLHALRWSTLISVGLIFPILIIIYSCFSLLGFSTVTYARSYTISAGQLSGLAPAIVLFFMYLIMLIGSHSVFCDRLDKVIKRSNLVDMSKLTAYMAQLRWAKYKDASAQGNFFIFLPMMVKGILCSKPLKMIAVILMNLAVAVSVNLLYISATFSKRYTASDIFFFSITLSIFKLIWARYAIPRLATLTNPIDEDEPEEINDTVSLEAKYFDLSNSVKNQSFMVTMTIFNTIIMPCFAVIVASPQALLYMFLTPLGVYTSFDLPECLVFGQGLLTVNSSTPFLCTDSITSHQDISFIPPFSYRYGGSFALLQAYSSVFTYMLLISTFVSPLISVCLVILLQNLKPNTFFSDLIADLLPQIALPPQHLGKWRIVKRCIRSFKQFQSTYYRRDIAIETNSPIHDDEINGRKSIEFVNRSSTYSAPESSEFRSKLPYKIFSSKVFISQTAQIMSIIFSFGIVFPPLAVLGFIAMFTKTYYLQIMMRRFRQEIALKNSSYWNIYIDILNKDCDKTVILIRRCLWWSFPPGFLVLSLYLFDMMGGVFPGEQEQFAAILPGVFLIVTMIIYIIWWNLAKFGVKMNDLNANVIM